MTTHYSPMPPKGALRSKAVWGAIATLAGTFIPLGANALGYDLGGFQFNPDTGVVSFNAYSIGGALFSTLVPGGGLLAGFGRLVGKRAIRGLW